MKNKPKNCTWLCGSSMMNLFHTFILLPTSELRWKSYQPKVKWHLQNFHYSHQIPLHRTWKLWEMFQHFELQSEIQKQNKTKKTSSRAAFSKLCVHDLSSCVDSGKMGPPLTGNTGDPRLCYERKHALMRYRLHLPRVTVEFKTNSY